LVPRLRGSSAQLAARDATDAAIAKLGTPVVRANELDEAICSIEISREDRIGRRK